MRGPSIKQQQDAFDRQNRELAELILAAPEKYQGLQLGWATLWLERHPPKKVRPKPVQCELFGEAA
jgi:hypothetical protein